jgi:hypothetical protein
MDVIVDSVKQKGRFRLIHERNGIILQDITYDNLIVDKGLEYFASRNAGDGTLPISHMAVGTGLSAPLVSDTVLLNEIGRAVTVNTKSTTNITGDTAVFTTLFDKGVGVGALTEAGLFNDPVAGTMVSHIVFPVIHKELNDIVTGIWSIQSK